MNLNDALIQQAPVELAEAILCHYGDAKLAALVRRCKALAKAMDALDEAEVPVPPALNSAREEMNGELRQRVAGYGDALEAKCLTVGGGDEYRLSVAKR